MNCYTDCIKGMFDINDAATSTFRIKNYINWFYNAAEIYIDVPELHKLYYSIYNELRSYAIMTFNIVI